MIYTLLSIVFVSIISYFVWKNFADEQKYVKLPGPLMFPFIGSSFTFLGKTPVQIFEIFLQLSRKYGPNWMLGNGFNTVFVILEDPKDIETVLSSQKLITKGVNYKYAAVNIFLQRKSMRK